MARTKVGQLAPGSYGLLYVHDGEHPAHRLSFHGFRLAEGSGACIHPRPGTPVTRPQVHRGRPTGRAIIILAYPGVTVEWRRRDPLRQEIRKAGLWVEGAGPMKVEFRLLGQVEVRLDGKPIDVGYAQLKAVLALLLVEVNHVVAVDRLVDRVWGDRRLPQRPRGAIQHSIALLRAALAPVPGFAITWQQTGYQLAAEPGTVDLHRFHQLIADARTAGDDPRAVALFGEALELWRGEPFAGLDIPWLAERRTALFQQRDAAELELTDIRLRQGGHAELLPGLAERTRDDPLDERLAAQLMLALYRTGRAAHALVAAFLGRRHASAGHPTPDADCAACRASSPDDATDDARHRRQHRVDHDLGAGDALAARLRGARFLQPTFDVVVARHPLPPGGAHPPSRYNPHDAIYTAAAYLCDSGARDGRDLHAAIFAHNRAEWYVQKVLLPAQRYMCGAAQAPNSAAQAAIDFACNQLGLPYVRGGNGPAVGDAGFDCSGLTKAAYAAAGIELPRTAQTQFQKGPRILVDQIVPGDPVFFGVSSGKITHVGIAVSGQSMVNAPDFGKPVQVGPVGSRVIGATRPSDR